MKNAFSTAPAQARGMLHFRVEPSLDLDAHKFLSHVGWGPSQCLDLSRM